NFDFTKANENIEAFVTLYATSVGGRAYEYQEKQQGYFTYVLVDGLRGAAATNGQVTLGGLKRYIEQTVPKLVSRDLGAKSEQRPYAIVEGYQAEDLVLAVAAPAVEPPAPSVRYARVSGNKPLVTMSFTTAKVDASGRVTRLPGQTANGYIE